MTTTSKPLWTIMVIAGAQQYTEAAISDVLAQTVPTKLLLIGQALESPFRRHLEQIAEANDERVFVWHFEPQLSLSAAWNRGLRMAWECGADEAMVVNNDLRLHVDTFRILSTARYHLRGLFVSAVGVTAEQFDPDVNYREDALPGSFRWGDSMGGPDYSCFLLSKEGHEKYPFDENFYPCYGEDCSNHREYMLGGDGSRIFSINLPYHHIASGTLKAMAPEARMKLERQIEGSRAYYRKRWGGPVNGERFTIPFDPESAQDGVTNPELQGMVADPGTVREASGDAVGSATPSSTTPC